MLKSSKNSSGELFAIDIASLSANRKYYGCLEWQFEGTEIIPFENYSENAAEIKIVQNGNQKPKGNHQDAQHVKQYNKTKVRTIEIKLQQNESKSDSKIDLVCDEQRGLIEKNKIVQHCELK